MPRNITVYRVFIGSPGGLDAERERFRDVLQRYNRVHARRHDVEFEPVGWEDTLPGGGRPQGQINADLERCDYALFTFHDRWGSPTGSGDLVGTEEEWQIAQRLNSAEGGYQIRHIGLYFKSVPAAQLNDPGEALRKVQAFKDTVFESKQHLCGEFKDTNEFADKIERHLADWLAKHLRPSGDATNAVVNKFQDDGAAPLPSAFAPDFDFWSAEAHKSIKDNPSNFVVILSFFERALLVASTDFQKAESLYNKGVTLGRLERFAEEISSYNYLIAHFGSSEKAELRELVAKSLLNRGHLLGTLDRSVDQMSSYDELISRFGSSKKPELEEQVAHAYNNKGAALGLLNCNNEAIENFNDLIARFDEECTTEFHEHLAKAIYNKGVALGRLGRCTDAITSYDDLIARFGSSDEVLIQKQVASAMFNKACALALQARVADCIKVLEQWAQKSGGFNCEEVANDSDFDIIRARPKFAKFLKNKGCMI